MYLLVNCIVCVGFILNSAAEIDLSAKVDDARECNANIGPAGINRCVKLNPYYNNYQWATCLSNAYIQTLTGGRHHCMVVTNRYCWYQCTLETYESMGPSVYGDCLCNGTSYSTTPATPGSTLPSECYSPDGSDCDWYADCLEAKYPCRGTSAGYAIEYATKFCRLYNENLGNFTALGQRWVNAVRKCLQVRLVSLLRQYKAPTCSDIRTTAFNSHTPCYLQRNITGSPSVCDLPLSDYFTVMWTIKSAFVDPSTSGETLCAGLDVFKGCKDQWGSTRPCLRAVVVDVSLVYTASEMAENPALVAARVASAIAKAMHWDRQNLRFLGCLVDWMTPSTFLANIVMFVPDHVSCFNELTSGKRAASSMVDLDEVVRDLENAVKSGSLLMEIDGVTTYVTAIGECADGMSCTNTTATNIKAPALRTTPSPSAADAVQPPGIMILSAVLIFMLIVNMLVKYSNCA